MRYETWQDVRGEMDPHRTKAQYVPYDKMAKKTSQSPRIKKVLFRAPATIVFWDDGTKTVVKCSDNDKFDPEKGMAMAIAKKFFGNEGNYYNEFKKWLPEEEPEVVMGPVEKALNNVMAAIYNNPFPKFVP